MPDGASRRIAWGAGRPAGPARKAAGQFCGHLRKLKRPAGPARRPTEATRKPAGAARRAVGPVRNPAVPARRPAGRPAGIQLRGLTGGQVFHVDGGGVGVGDLWCRFMMLLYRGVDVHMCALHTALY